MRLRKSVSAKSGKRSLVPYWVKPAASSREPPPARARTQLAPTTSFPQSQSMRRGKSSGSMRVKSSTSEPRYAVSRMRPPPRVHASATAWRSVRW